jgi:hypothetical protein
VILKVLGVLKEEDVCHLSDMKSIKYVEKNLMNVPRINFSQEFPFSKDIGNLISKMLEFNPFFRKSANELL